MYFITKRLSISVGLGQGQQRTAHINILKHNEIKWFSYEKPLKYCGAIISIKLIKQHNAD